jgi:hypothetical protein
MSKTQIYPLTKRPQLIDLNGENVNFKLNFNVKSINPEHEFNAIVLTQEQLDSVDINKIEMKHAKGKINGNIIANNNKYQNYFLVLKKLDNNTADFNVQVDIILEPVEAVEQPPVPQQELPSEISASNTAPNTITPAVLPFYKKPWFKVFILLVIVCLGFLFYNIFYLKKPFLFWNKAKLLNLPKVSSTPIAVSAPVPAPTVAPLTTVPSTVENNLYKKLQEIA